MPDDIDSVCEREQGIVGMTLAARARPHGASATHCQAWRCGEPIPEARRLALPGVQLCIDCATINEKKNRRAA